MSGEAPQAIDLLTKYVNAGDSLGTAVDVPSQTPATIEFVRPSGDRWSIAYHQLLWCEYREEVPATAKGAITLHFRDHAVRVSGMRLLPLWRALQEHRPSSIRVSDRTTAFVEKSAPVVDAIEMPRRPEP